jgi:hypothetical protein
VAFNGDFGTFDPNMFLGNSNLTTITSCQGKTGWPQTFGNMTTTPISCSPPDAPPISSIAAGDGEAIISFTPGADNGLPITGYTALCFNTVSDYSIVSSSTSPITVTGLTNGVSYVCVVPAANDAGTSQASEASAVIPSVDTDGDSVNDLLDKCVSIANPDQEPSAINPDCGEACVTSNCAGTFCENH